MSANVDVDLAPGVARTIRRRFRLLAVAILASGALLLGVTAWITLHNIDQRRNRDAGTTASRVVSPRLETLLSYDPTTIGSAATAHRDWLAAPFRGEYAALIGQLKPAVKSMKTTSTAKVVRIGVVSSTTDDAVLLAFVDVTLKSATGADKNGSISGSRLRVSVHKNDGNWVITELKTI